VYLEYIIELDGSVLTNPEQSRFRGLVRNYEGNFHFSFMRVLVGWTCYMQRFKFS